jgi:hypothetical protein
LKHLEENAPAKGFAFHQISPNEAELMRKADRVLYIRFDPTVQPEVDYELWGGTCKQLQMVFSDPVAALFRREEVGNKAPYWGKTILEEVESNIAEYR